MHEQFSAERHCFESLSVVTLNWKTLLIDCPDSWIKSLILDKELESDSKMTKIDYLFVTHIDSDHISWLAKLLWHKKFWENTKLKLITHPRIKEQLWRHLNSTWFDQDRTKDFPCSQSFEDYIDFIPLDYRETINISWFWMIKAFSRPTRHSPNMDMMAIKVYDENFENIANFSWDTAFDSELIDFLSEWWGDIIHEVWAYVERWSHSHTWIAELIEHTSQEVQNRLFINHIPLLLDGKIRDAITAAKSPIRLADCLYADSIKQLVKETLDSKNLRERVYPGSFDPFTLWHLSVIRKQLKSNPWEYVSILVSTHPDKKTMFFPEERVFLTEKSIPDDIASRVKIIPYDWVIADYIYENRSGWVIKWLRNTKDFEYEMNIAKASNRFSWEVNTTFLPQLDNELDLISSSSLKMLAYYWWDTKWFANPLVLEAVRMKLFSKLILWVTWSIGSWKSTYCKNIESYSKNESLPIHYINLDLIWREIHERKDLPIFQEIRNQIADKFWSWVLFPDGTTNRKKLWEFVFSSNRYLDELMDIMLVPMLHFLRKKLLALPEWNGIVLVEWAIITERKLTYLFDENMVDITIPEDLQYKRVKERDNLDDEQIRRRLATQLQNKDREEVIIRNQLGIYDRLYRNISWERYDLNTEYEYLTQEFNKRKNIIR